MYLLLYQSEIILTILLLFVFFLQTKNKNNREVQQKQNFWVGVS